MTDTNATFDVCAVFANGAKEILAARDMAGHIHASKDIRAAGNEVEVAVRDYLARTLPAKFHVAHGHLIDSAGAVSPQQDIIISDNTLLPTLMRARDGTEYVPFDSTYAFGEVKSTYRHSDEPIQKFSSSIQKIKSGLIRPDLVNTAFGGEIKGDTLLFDAVHASPNRIQNPLFTFMVFVDKGDFDCEKMKNFFAATSNTYLPNIIVFLNAGVIIAADFTERGFSFNRYPELHPERGASRYFSPIHGTEGSTPEGNHLAFLYYALILHLAESRIENSFSAKYFEKSFIFRKSTTETIKE
jgi:hypothetical protein